MENKVITSKSSEINIDSKQKIKKITVNFYAYKCNGHTEGGRIGQPEFNYSVYFTRLMESVGIEVGVYGEDSEEKIILASSNMFNDIILFQIAETTGETATAYNQELNRVERVKAGDDLKFANEVWLAVSQTNPRYIAVQRKFKGNGVSIQNITKLLEKFSREIYGNNSVFTLEPLISSSFAEEVEKLERVTKVALRINRPNYTWNGFEGVIDELGQESNAGAMVVEAIADRGSSLDQDKGIVEEVKNIHEIPINGIESAKVSGYYPGSKDLSTISTNQNTIKEKRLIHDTNDNMFRRTISNFAGTFLGKIRKNEY